MNKKAYRQHFTLIEMLIVVGIASLLFALVGPSFQRMVKGNAVERHASGLKLGMERGRALAISGRRYVAMLLPSKTTGDSETDKFRYGGYRLCYVTQENPDGTEGDKDNTKYVLDGWIPETEWTNNGRDEAYLLEIASSDDPKTVKDNDTKAADHTDNKKFTGEELLSTVKTTAGYLPALIFTPYGDIRGGSDDTELYFYVCGQYTYDRFKIRINKLTGKVEFVE